MQPYHGKAVALDILDLHAPFPSIFIIHELCVRAFNPFAPVSPDVPGDLCWQDWIESEEVLNSDGSLGLFSHQGDHDHSARGINTTLTSLTPIQPQMAGGVPSGRSTLPPLDGNLIEKILASTYASPSWKACVVEGMSWAGTADENIEKYRQVTGQV